MILVPYSPTLFTILGREIRWYGLIYALSLLFVYLYLLKNLDSLEFDSRELDNYFFGLILSGIVGARFFDFVFYYPQRLIQDPLSVLQIWNGGLSFHGFLIASLLFTYIYTKNHSQNMWNLADMIVIPASFALGLGRIGNFMNHELIGKLWDSPYCFVFATATGCRYPSQLFEAFYMFVIFGILIYLKIKQVDTGRIFLTFITLYGLFRFIFNFFRDDPIVLLGIGMGQILSLVMFAIGIYIFIKTKNE